VGGGGANLIINQPPPGRYYFVLGLTPSSSPGISVDITSWQIKATYNPVVTASAGSGGTISPNRSIAESYNGSQIFTASPSANYTVNQWLVDGSVVQTGGNYYTLSNIQTAHSVQVTFTYVPPQYTVSASAGSGGTISPNGSIAENAGSSQLFTASPNANYTVNQWIEDGSVVQTGGITYTLSNIQAAHSVQVTFTYVPPQLTNLGIAPAGNQTVLFWPTTFTNYVLQSTTNLASPNWGLVTDAVPVTVSNAVTITVTNTSPARFFRLYNTNPPAGMALIPAGVFTIGDTLDGESDAIPTVTVNVSAFYMDVNLVSSNQWAAVYSYATGKGYTFADAGSAKAGNNPVQTVDWFDTVKWCNARSVQAGLKPVYYTDAGFTQVFTNGDSGTTVYANWGANGYRLPTEAEWEKAARGGLTGNRFPWGNSISESQANYYGATGSYAYDLGPNGYNATYATGGYPYTSPVGSFAANGYGLYDMAGNVFEWCWDWYAGPPYPAGSPYLGGTNPTGAGPGSGFRVLRGASWDDYAGYARCACRDVGYPNYASIYFGFRCVRGL
jgi:formylglycine-generating enzyme required for sulfatase activity